MKVLVLLAALCGSVLGAPQVNNNGKYNNPETRRFLAGVLGHLISPNQVQGLPPCKFPFIWGGVTHSTCTTWSDSDDLLWCSTKTNDTGYHVSGVNNVKYCTLDDVLMAAARRSSLGNISTASGFPDENDESLSLLGLESYGPTYDRIQPATTIQDTISFDDEPGQNKVEIYKWVSLQYPASVNLTKSLPPISNQGDDCESGWAFSITCVMEYHLYTYQTFGITIKLSEQYLIDCDTVSYGCNGGFPDQALLYLVANKLVLSSNYEYKGKKQACNEDVSTETYYVYPYIAYIKYGNDNDLLNAFVNLGVMSVSIYASSEFKNYTGVGIFDDPKGLCMDKGKPRTPNHAVALVGYGTENDHEYWLVRNSMGVNWGDKGYIKMTREKTNFCSISSQAFIIW